MTIDDPYGPEHIAVVKWLANQFVGRGLEFDDLFNEGNLGLLAALDTYDAAKGTKLSTYVGVCVRNQLRNATKKQGWWAGCTPLNESSLVDEPQRESAKLDVSRYLECLSEMERQTIRLRFGLDREPLTLREIGEMLGRSGRRIGQLEKAAITKMRCEFAARASDDRAEGARS